MRAIILSAGQGTRLLPWTARTPKCLLPVQEDRCVLELQLRALAACGVREAVVVTGFGADQVDAFLRERRVPRIRTRSLFNPFFRTADNLVSAWLAVREMRDDFVMLNGDTLFQTEALEQLLATPKAPVTLAINRKRSYDSDDMKVSLDGRRLRAVGKAIEERVDGESIGLMVFRGDGVHRIRETLDECVRVPEGRASYYLSAVDRLARTGRVETLSIEGLWWQEIDDPSDWVEARAALEPREGRLGVIPAGVLPRVRAQAQRRRHLSVFALLAAALPLLLLVGPRAVEAGESLPDFEPSVEGERDGWLSGPTLKLYATDGVVRPYVLGGMGRQSDVRRLRIGDPTNRFQDAPFAGRVGGGLDVRVTNRSTVSLEGSYLQPEGFVQDEAAGTVGLKLKLRF